MSKKNELIFQSLQQNEMKKTYSCHLVYSPVKRCFVMGRHYHSDRLTNLEATWRRQMATGDYRNE